GVSYGTRHALAYAAAHPAHVSRLVLDSVVPLDSSESFRLPTLHAVPQAVRDLCRAGACRGLSRDPLADFARLANRLERKPLVATVTAGEGKEERGLVGGGPPPPPRGGSAPEPGAPPPPSPPPAAGRRG